MKQIKVKSRLEKAAVLYCIRPKSIYQKNSALLQKATIIVAVSSFHLLLCGPPVSKNKAMILVLLLIVLNDLFFLSEILALLVASLDTTNPRYFNSLTSVMVVFPLLLLNYFLNSIQVKYILYDLPFENDISTMTCHLCGSVFKTKCDKRKHLKRENKLVFLFFFSRDI